MTTPMGGPSLGNMDPDRLKNFQEGIQDGRIFRPEIAAKSGGAAGAVMAWSAFRRYLKRRRGRHER